MPRFLGRETCMQIEDCVGGEIRTNHEQLDVVANQIASMLPQLVKLLTGVENNSQTASNNTRTLGKLIDTVSKLLERVANQTSRIDSLSAAKPSGGDPARAWLSGAILFLCLVAVLLLVAIYRQGKSTKHQGLSGRKSNSYRSYRTAGPGLPDDFWTRAYDGIGVVSDQDYKLFGKAYHSGGSKLGAKEDLLSKLEDGHLSPMAT
jgi:hypothetical protein